jgi:hypothetical protein
MSIRLFAGILAGALMVPQVAIGAEASAFQLPPIPYGETIPWLTGGTVEKPRSYLALLLAPRPLVVTPTEFAAVPTPGHSALSTQLATEGKVFTE